MGSSIQIHGRKKANFGGTGRRSNWIFNRYKRIYRNGNGSSGLTIKIFGNGIKATDTWTQKANFGGATRAWAVGFSIGTKDILVLVTADTLF